MKSLSKQRKILIIIVGILFILSLNFFQKEVKGFFYSVSEPIQKVLWRAGDRASDFLGEIFRAKNLKKENEELRLKIQELLAENSSLKEVEKENRALREALELGLQKEFRLELAEIIGKDINQDTILIDKGLKDGISKGLTVITAQKVLIGNTVEVYQNYSRVLLISDEKSSFEGRVAQSNISGLVKGLGGSRVSFKLIPKESELKEGDLVVSRGLLIGLVKEVKKIDVSPFQEAEISPFFDISNLGKIFIILNPVTQNQVLNIENPVLSTE